MCPVAQMEQRQHPRKAVNIEVRLSCHNKANTSSTVLVHDLSLKGMAVQITGLPLTIGDRLCICLAATSSGCGPEHMIEARVINLRNGLAGLQFESVGVMVLKDIQQLLHEERSF